MTPGLLAPARQIEARRVDDSVGNDWRMMRDFCLQHSYALHPHKQEFVASLRYWRGDLTEKQSAWLAAIFADVRRKAA